MSISTEIRTFACAPFTAATAGSRRRRPGDVIAPIAAFSGVVASTLITATHGVLLVAAAGVFAGGAVGLVNGVLIARWRINSLIVTLATM
ncbi:arabinose transporter permease, partial [Burkholderia pseudomallei]